MENEAITQKIFFDMYIEVHENKNLQVRGHYTNYAIMFGIILASTVLILFFKPERRELSCFA